MTCDCDFDSGDCDGDDGLADCSCWVDSAGSFSSPCVGVLPAGLATSSGMCVSPGLVMVVVVTRVWVFHVGFGYFTQILGIHTNIRYLPSR